MDGAPVQQHLGALIIVMNYILLLSGLVDGCIVVAAGSVTTIMFCSVDKLNGF
jgi:hypothetical protein